MSTNRELHELAAKAAGYEVAWHHANQCYMITEGASERRWQPEMNARYAMMLAKQLKMTIDFETGSIWGAGELDETRLAAISDQGEYMAILEAAAEVGRRMV